VKEAISGQPSAFSFHLFRHAEVEMKLDCWLN